MFRRRKPKSPKGDVELRFLREQHKLEQAKAHKCLEGLPPEARTKKARDMMEELLSETLRKSVAD